MNLKNLTATLTAVAVFGLSSCKKDFISPENDSINGAVVSNDATANDVLETAAPVHTAKNIAINSNVSGFWESLPARYKLTTKKYPLIVFIHGIGELGTGLSRVNCCGLPKHLYNKSFPAKFLVNGVYYSFIVVSPQFRKRPTAAQVQSVVDYAKSKYRVDATRVYVTGLSMGGGSTWDFSAVYGQNAAAILPVCGGTKPTTTLASKIAAKNLPIWTISSSGDAVVPISWAKNWISWIDARNSKMAGSTKITVWSSESHNATWARAFNPSTRVDGYNIYEWLLRFKRGSAPAPAPAPAPTPTPTGGKPVAVAGPDQVIPVSWKYMPFLNGTKSTDNGWIKAFKWTKISGPSSYWFEASTKAQTKANGLVAGTYVFRLTVTDNQGNTAYDDVKVTMTGSGTASASAPGAPIARAGADQSIPKSWNYKPKLNATTSTDPDGWITKFKWTKVSGPAAWFEPTSTVAQPTITGAVPGTYVFRVTVTDNSGKTSSDDVRIVITNN